MAEWAAKRFWQQTSVKPHERGFTVWLDTRMLRTPAKAELVLPTQAMAEAIASEWDAQTGKINPDTMPYSRMANSAIDKLISQREAVALMLAEYGGTDLLCYRADAPPQLVARQADAWNPLLTWAENTLNAPLNVTAGILPIAQPQDSLDRLTAEVLALDVFRLAAFHDLVAISGSFVLALALVRGEIDVDLAWAMSRVDETWQTEQWGHDEEAAQAEAVKQAAFSHAYRFFGICG